MLLALRPDFVSEHWDEIREELEKALPPVGICDGMSMNRILERILVGGLTCWCVAGSDKKIQGFLLTYVSEDYCTGTKTLILYASTGEFTADVWVDGVDVITKYAKYRECRRIGAYTSNRASLYMAKRFGANIDTRYFYLEV